MSVISVSINRQFLIYVGRRWIKDFNPRISVDGEEYYPSVVESTVPDGYCISSSVYVQPTTDKYYSDFRVIVNYFTIGNVSSRTVTRRFIEESVFVPGGKKLHVSNEYCIRSTQAVDLP